MKRFLRTFLVLCLCCSIVFSAAIPQAQALDPITGAVLYNIAENIGVGTGLRAIGVGPGNSPKAFNKLVNDIANSDIFNSASQILIAGAAGDYKGFLQKTFLQDILDFLVDSGAVSFDSSGVSSITFSFNGDKNFRVLEPNHITPASANFFVGKAYLTSSSLYYYICYASSSSDFVLADNNSSTKYGASIPDGGTFYVTSPSYAINSVNTSLPIVDFGTCFDTHEMTTMASNYDPSLSSSLDLTLDSVASSVDSSLYDSWTANGGTYDGGDYIPVSIPSLDASAISAQTQAQAQAGTIPDAVVEEIVAGSEAVPDTDTGTIAGVIDAIKALPQTLSDLFSGIRDAVLSIPQAIADVFSPPAASEAFQISLTDFFPFCIPFDLYNLLDALAAAPEAPVIQGVIPVPTFGQVYDIEVDLSEWDNIASLFRTLQLGLFIVGLALVTRERFLRS